MAWVGGFLTGGLLGAIAGSAGGFMINHKKEGDKWVNRIPQPLYLARQTINVASISAGFLAGAFLGGAAQSAVSFAGLPIGEHTKIVNGKELTVCDRTGLIK